jgi:hypothetical protein
LLLRHSKTTASYFEFLQIAHMDITCPPSPLFVLFAKEDQGLYGCPSVCHD